MDNKIKILIFNTLQKEYRNKTLIFFTILTVILIFGINALLNLIGQLPGLNLEGNINNKKLLSFFYIINLWNTLLSIIVGINCVKSDIKSGVILQILSLPLKRSYFLFTRILGSSAIVLAYYFLAFLMALIVFMFGSNEIFSFNFKMILGLIPTALLIISTITITVLLSLYLSKIQSLFAALGTIFFISHFNRFFSGLTLKESLNELTFFRLIGFVTHNLLPRIGVYDSISRDLILGNSIDYNLWIEIPHFVLTYSFLTWICHVALSRKEF